MSEKIRPKVLIVDDVPTNVKILRDAIKSEGYKIFVADNGEDGLRIAFGALPDIILLDILMEPGIDGYEVCRRLKQNQDTEHIPVIFITVKENKESVIESFQVGGVDYITKPFYEDEVRVRVKTHLKNSLLTQEVLQKNKELREEIERREQAEEEKRQAEQARDDAEDTLNDQLQMISQQEAQRWGIEGFIGKSETIRKILSDVRQLQNADKIGVLIVGESGTGKELIARAIHFGSARAKKRFAPLNCSTIPRELAESTLFGHIRGAFTGANENRKGYFELADGGTLFLDEIGEMLPELQVKLLRTLDDGCITPVGSTQEKQVNVRILAATNTDLQMKIAEGTFREALYHRLTRFIVPVPPLRERKEDIPLLASHFLKMFTQEMGIQKPVLTPEAMSALETYHFPGNVRELKNIIERALITNGGSAIQPEHLLFISSNYSSTTLLANAIEGQKSVVRPADFEQRKQLVIKRAQKKYTGNGELTLQTDASPMTNEEKILAYLEEHGSINNSECRSLLSVDFEHAAHLLKKLHKYGLIVYEGERRWRRYRLP